MPTPHLSTRRRIAGRARTTGAAAVLLAVALVAASCSSDSDSTSTSTSEATSSESSTSEASSALVPLDTAAMDTVVDELATQFREVGMMVLVKTPEGDYTKSWGTLGLDSTEVPTADTKVRIGSNTKTWTGTVILQMVQEGKISVEDPVSKYRPDVPNGENITIAQLLDMRSGLYNYTQTLELNDALDNDPQRVWEPEQLLALAFADPPVAEPGAEYNYSNTNTVLLGLIAEQLDGKPIAQIYQDRLFSTLNMTSTSFPANTDTSIPDTYANGYSYSGNVETLGEGKESLSPERLAAIEEGTVQPRITTNDNPSWTWSAGQGISTANDLVTWVEALGNGDLLDEETQALRMDSVQPSDPSDPSGSSYGYGIAQMGPMYGHIGEMPGYNSFMGYDPVNDVTIVVWGTLAPTPEGAPPAAAVAKSLVPLVYASSTEDTGEHIDDAAEDTSGG
ncbi:MAG: serine hydrolase domain-containing protein [Rhodococcus sp. (in: high G+C Gram-positive bacteria)]|jgi:D-alanyl-D-alanine carboxypeptidase